MDRRQRRMRIHKRRQRRTHAILVSVALAAGTALLSSSASAAPGDPQIGQGAVVDNGVVFILNYGGALSTNHRIQAPGIPGVLLFCNERSVHKAECV